LDYVVFSVLQELRIPDFHIEENNAPSVDGNVWIRYVISSREITGRVASDVCDDTGSVLYEDSQSVVAEEIVDSA
jgi:hypothetical protein